MISETLLLIGLTLLPFLELRASIPFGIFKTNLTWYWVFIVCIIVNIILGPVIYLLLNKIVKIATRFKRIERMYQRYIEKTQKKIHKAVDRWGELGVALFIGVPLPGSGVYSGAIGSHIIGLSHKKFFKATVLGVLIAGGLVLAISLTGAGGWELFVKNF